MADELSLSLGLVSRDAFLSAREKCHSYDWIFITRPCYLFASDLTSGNSSGRNSITTSPFIYVPLKLITKLLPSPRGRPCKSCRNFVPRHYEITCPFLLCTAHRTPRIINLRCVKIIKNCLKSLLHGWQLPRPCLPARSLLVWWEIKLLNREYELTCHLKTWIDSLWKYKLVKWG